MFKASGPRTGTKHWKAAEASEVLARWRASGLTRTAFAEREGLSPERLRRWEHRLAEGDAAVVAETGLVPMVVHESAGLLTAARVQLPGGVVLEVDAARVDPRWVAALILDVARGA